MTVLLALYVWVLSTLVVAGIILGAMCGFASLLGGFMVFFVVPAKAVTYTIHYRSRYYYRKFWEGMVDEAELYMVPAWFVTVLATVILSGVVFLSGLGVNLVLSGAGPNVPWYYSLAMFGGVLAGGIISFVVVELGEGR